MPLLVNPHLDLTTSRIETDRCVLVPFSLDGRVDIHELTEQFCLANQDLYVSAYLPNYEEELVYIDKSIESMKQGEMFENFIINRETGRLIGAGGIRTLESGELNIGIWICRREHGQGYATEVYRALIDWAREHADAEYLVHSLNPENEPSRKLALRFGGVLQSEIGERGHQIYHIPL